MALPFSLFAYTTSCEERQVWSPRNIKTYTNFEPLPGIQTTITRLSRDIRTSFHACQLSARRSSSAAITASATTHEIKETTRREESCTVSVSSSSQPSRSDASSTTCGYHYLGSHELQARNFVVEHLQHHADSSTIYIEVSGDARAGFYRCSTDGCNQDASSKSQPIRFGAIMAPYRTTSVSYLWSLELWRAITSSRICGRHRLTVCMFIPACVILAALVGPASAILMIPRIVTYVLENQITFMGKTVSIYPPSVDLSNGQIG